MKKLDEDLEKLLMSLNDDERKWLGSYYNPRFPRALSVVLLVWEWKPEDVVNMVEKAWEVDPDNVID